MSYDERKVVFDSKNFRRLMVDYYEALGEDVFKMIGWRKVTYIRLMRGQKQPCIQQLVEFSNFVGLHPAEFFELEGENGHID